MPKKKTKVIKNQKIAKEERIKKYRIIKSIIKFILIIGVLVGIGVFALTSPLFNISEINVTGESKNTKSLYTSLSGIKLQENIFNFRKKDIISNIEKEPYVDNVEVKRKLPSTIEIKVKERTTKFLFKLDEEKYAYIDENGYVLEISTEKLPLIVLIGYSTDSAKIIPGTRLIDDDVEKLNDVSQILNAISINEINQEMNTIDITSKHNSNLKFEKEAKEAVLGDISDLNTKMLYMKYVLNEQEGVPGTIYLEKTKVYFSPK